MHSKKEQERQLLEAHLQAEMACAHQKKLRELEARYLSRIGELGHGHCAAQSVEEVKESRGYEVFLYVFIPGSL